MTPPIVDKIPQNIKDWYIFLVIIVVSISIILTLLKIGGIL